MRGSGQHSTHIPTVNLILKFHRKMEEDNEKRRRERLSRHIPGPLQGK